MKSKLLQYTVNTDAVKDRMLALGMTITQLAKATGFGNQRIYRFFRGTQTLPTVHAIADALHCSISDFVTRKE
jgi:transcriptional regulator with XRE-family HTH domain